MRNAVAVAAAMSVTKYTVSWNSVTRWKRCWNGTVSRKPNSTWTPGIATRSSFSSSIIWRFSRSCWSSLRSCGRSGASFDMATGIPGAAALQAAGASAAGGAEPGLRGAGDRRDRVAHRVDRPADEARDVHLRHPDRPRDLALGHALVVAQVQDLALAGAERL